jgi:hypothetical protein
MVEQERVRKAVEGPVSEALKLLDEARSADTETRLVMLINGWGRGLAAGLEELALAIDDLRRLNSPEPSPHAADDEPRREPNEGGQTEDAASADRKASDEPDEEEVTEERLRARAAESRAATAALREEASSELGSDRDANDE